MKMFALLSLIWFVAGCESAIAGEQVASTPACVCPSMTTTEVKDADYSAQPNEHVLVNFNTALPGDITITLPMPNPSTKGARVRVTDVSADGGLGNGAALRVAGTFGQIQGGHYAASPYVVAGVFMHGVWNSRRGANIELYDNGDGWLVVAESCRPVL